MKNLYNNWNNNIKSNNYKIRKLDAFELDLQ